MFGASLFYFFVTFENWVFNLSATVESAESGRAVCWPYFQECYKWFFLQGPAHGWSQNIFYTILFAIMLTVVWSMWRKKWSLAHALVVLLFIWKVLFEFVFVYNAASPYHYYHLILTAVLLFIPYKEFFMKLCFVFFYFMAVTTKFDETWILGTYFTSLQPGLPIFPDSLTALFTNLVIGMQIIGCWFLISRNMFLQRTALVYFVTFHLYSIVFVWYNYPSITLPSLLILFGPLYRHTPIPFTRKAIAGWVVIALVALFQIPPFVVSENRQLTLEGNRFGMFMFEGNHQCIMEVTTYRWASGAVKESNREVPAGKPCNKTYCLVETDVRSEGDYKVTMQRYEGDAAWHRCDPYVWWSQLHRQCDINVDVDRVAFTFDHSVNGGPFYRMVDVPNICDLSYTTFQHNEWIKLPPEAPVMGYPVKNTYR